MLAVDMAKHFLVTLDYSVQCKLYHLSLHKCQLQLYPTVCWCSSTDVGLIANSFSIDELSEDRIIW